MIIEWRNRDVDVSVGMQFRTEDDPDNWRYWISVKDMQCIHARWDDENQMAEPSRHVEIGLTMFDFRFTIMVCVPLRSQRDPTRDYIQGGMSL